MWSELGIETELARYFLSRVAISVKNGENAGILEVALKPKTHRILLPCAFVIKRIEP